MSHHLIFEGAELAGKSWLMSEIYNFLEPKYNRGGKVLNGCHWFNCDIGFYGTDHGKAIIKNYLKIFEELKDTNLIIEKFHLSDNVYNKIHRNKDVDYSKEEKELKKLNFKIVLVTFPEDEEIIKERIKDRLNLYPHYSRIVQEPKWYIKQQQMYLKLIEQSELDFLIVKAEKLPDKNMVKKILNWVGEDI